MLRLATLLAIVALATAIPSLNLPTVAPAHGFNATAAAFEDKLHSEFVAWKSKVGKSLPPPVCNKATRSGAGGRGPSARTGARGASRPLVTRRAVALAGVGGLRGLPRIPRRRPRVYSTHSRPAAC
jgi:hypothetical protein